MDSPAYIAGQMIPRHTGARPEHHFDMHSISPVSPATGLIHMLVAAHASAFWVYLSLRLRYAAFSGKAIHQRMDRSVVKTQHSAGLSLAQKGLLLLALPLCFQLVLISVLYYFHDRAEQYAIRAGNARDLSSALSRFSTRAYSCIYRIDEGLWHHQQTSPLALDNIQKLAQEADDLKASLQKAAHQRDYKMPQ